jgi:hypothetical protein
MLTGKRYQTCLEFGEALSTLVWVPLDSGEADLKVCNYPINVLKSRRRQAVIGLLIVG